MYAAVPGVLSLLVPVYARVAARFGARAVTVGSLVFFSSHVVLFWYAFRFHAGAIAVHGSVAWLLPAAFYVWANCFGVIATVQAWSFANSLFDTREAKRLFGLIAGGASGAMSLAEPDAGAVLENWATLSMEVAPGFPPGHAAGALVRGRRPADARAPGPHGPAAPRPHGAQRRPPAGDGKVRPGLGLDAVRDVLYAYTSPELYEILVLQAGWTVEA